MATYKTVQQTIDRLTRLAGQVPGTSVQTYASDVFLDFINSAVRLISRRYWWPHLMTTIQANTDGSTGVLTADLSNIKDFTDIYSIFAGNSDRQLSYFSDLNNSALYSGSSACGFQAIPYGDAQYASKLIRIVPATAQELITIRARIVPSDLSYNDSIPFDQDLIVFGVLWSYFEDEGDNPQQAAKYATLFDSKFTEQVSMFGHHGVSTNQNAAQGSNDWLMT